MKNRPTVGLVIVDTESYALANNAIQHCVNAYPFDSVTVFTDQISYWPQYKTVEIPKIKSIEDYNRIILQDIGRHTDTDFILVIQFDGFILNASAFSEQYFDYDYIGAVWPNYEDRKVGNGGFSWRSRKLVQAVSQIEYLRAAGEAEDLFICRTMRGVLERDHGCRFAGETVANQFSHEIMPATEPTFGFHGIFHLPQVYRNAPKFLIDNLPERALKDQLGFVRYGLEQLPTDIKAEFSLHLEERLKLFSERQMPVVADSGQLLFQHLMAMGHQRSPHWQAFEEKPPLTSDKKVIAYYLPQFHTITENDENWGRGFTEWRNVSRALPLFQGHYQPRHPADLGFYDLNNPMVIAQQAQLARNYGLGGWAFYYYWFDSKKLLDMPIERLYQQRDINMPYCVFWANENWTRSWDGMQSNVLLSQKHSAEDDIAFVGAISKYFEDPRYIRFEGRPVLMMYRPQLLPNAQATTERWRNWCIQHGFGNPYLITTEAYGMERSSQHGFDAAAEFPPHRGSACDASQFRAPARLQYFGPQRDIQCIDYESAVAAWSRSPPAGSDKLFKCVFPMWDNSSRRVNSIPTVFQGSNPAHYERWLRYCLEQANPGDFVFVNAWNEWAEGAYLEPDLYFGHAYLEATWRAMKAAL